MDEFIANLVDDMLAKAGPMTLTLTGLSPTSVSLAIA